MDRVGTKSYAGKVCLLTFLSVVGAHRLTHTADFANDDRQFLPAEFAKLEQQFGRFEIDCFADAHGYNALCELFCSREDSVFEHDLAGWHVWMNAPFRRSHFRRRRRLIVQLCRPIIGTLAHRHEGCAVLPTRY